MRIKWNANIANAPCCAGEITAANGQSVLIQTDWDWPSVASTFGWTIASVQDNGPCDHGYTDGTIDCSECGHTASTFIARAGEWLDDHDGATADDPGYFPDPIDNA